MNNSHDKHNDIHKERKKHMKAWIRFLTSVTVAGTLLCGAAFAEHTGISGTDDSEKAQVLQLLEIMNGDENGNLNLEAPVTRAEFVKMAVNASVYKDSAGQSTVSLFPDVTEEHWARGYVSTAIKAGLVSGYLDGTFRPENTVKLEEAVIISLKLLGYTNDDFKGTYPDSQLAKYHEIDLDTGMTAVRGDTLTRLDCMRLLYNTLCVKTKNGTLYCTTLGHAADSDNTVDYLALLSADMTGPYVNKDGSLATRVGFIHNPNAVFYRDGKKSTLEALSDYDVYYYSSKLKTVWCYTDKEFGKITSVNPNRETPQSMTLGAATYSLTPAAAKKLTNAGGIGKDDYVMLMLDKDGAVADLVLADAALYDAYADKDADRLTEVNKTVSDPIVVKDLSTYTKDIPFDLSSATLLLDSEPISASDIRLNDVIYYSEPFRSVWVFRDTASGVCNAVSPNRQNPQSVTVGGKTYTLSTDDIVYKFSNYGTIKTDMLVTLLLGKDGGAVDVIAADESIIGDGENQVPYADIVSSTLKGPYIAEKNGTINSDEINLSAAVIYKGNKTVNAASIRQYDIYYYSKLLNTVWLYDDTVVGTVESIAPTRAMPTSVTVSGKTYTLESSGAQYALSSLGSYDVGDRVTLLLGKDGAVAGIAGAQAAGGKTVYGVVTSSGEKQYTDKDGKKYTADYITVFTVDGDTFTYEYDSSYKEGDAVKIIVTENKTQITGLSGPRSMSYAADVSNAVKDGKITSDAKIIDYYDADIHATVLPNRISGTSLSYSDIKYYAMNDAGEVEILILNNYTGDLVEYGLLTEVKGSTYKYILSDDETTFNSGDTRYTVSTGAAYFAISGNQITKIGNIKANVSLKIVDGQKGYTESGKAYVIDDNARVYIRMDGKYKACDVKDLEKGNYTMTGYYDKDPAYGGKIRVILAY